MLTALVYFSSSLWAHLEVFVPVVNLKQHLAHIPIGYHVLYIYTILRIIQFPTYVNAN